MVTNLLSITKITEKPSKNTKMNNKIISNFRLKIKQCFEQWWKTKSISSEGKLDFFFKYKKVFKCEEYINFLPRHIRRFITRLRTSSHNFPVETMRYMKNKPKREERKCNICALAEKGDELHYLLRCKNAMFPEIRQNFLDEIKVIIPQFGAFSLDNIVQYHEMG